MPTTITGLGADGYVTWTNVVTNATFIVQTATSLLSESNWVDYVQVPAASGVTTERLYDPNPPSGMTLIPAGSFTMGDQLIIGSTITNDPDITDANPRTSMSQRFTWTRIW